MYGSNGSTIIVFCRSYQNVTYFSSGFPATNSLANSIFNLFMRRNDIWLKYKALQTATKLT